MPSLECRKTARAFDLPDASKKTATEMGESAQAVNQVYFFRLMASPAGWLAAADLLSADPLEEPPRPPLLAVPGAESRTRRMYTLLRRSNDDQYAMYWSGGSRVDWRLCKRGEAI